MALPPIRNANVPGRFAQGMQTGNALQQLREQRMDRMRQDQARNALGQLVGGNAQPNSLAQLAQADPGAAMQFQQFQAQQQQATSEAEERENAMSAVRIHAMLSQGQVEPAMQMLANVPDSPQKQQAMQALSQGDVQGAMGVIEPVIEGYTRMGVLEAGPQPVSLSEGSRLVDPNTGQLVAQGGPKRPPTGRYRSEVDNFGNLTVIDTMTGEIVRRERPQLPEQQPQQPTGQGDVFGAIEQGTGPVASIRAGINNVIGPFVQGVPFEGANRSRAAIRNFNQEAKTALVNNPRFPVAEQEVVQRMLPNPEKFFQDPDAARQELQELQTFLTNKREQNLQSMQGGRVTAKEYGDLSNQVAAIDRVLGLMGPSGDQQGGNVIDFNDLPE